MKFSLCCFLIMVYAATTGIGVSLYAETGTDCSSDLSAILIDCQKNIASGNISEVRQLTAQAQQLFSTAEKKPDFVFRYNAQMGSCFVFLGDNPKANKYFKLALLWQSRTSEIAGSEIAGLYFNIGNLHAHTNNFTQAVHYFKAALSHSELTKQDMKRVVSYKASLALAYWNNLESIKAEELVDSCRLILNNLDNAPDVGLLDAYLTLIEYYLITQQEYPIIQVYLHNVSLILKKHFHENYYKAGIYYYYKGLYDFRKVTRNRSIHFYNHAETIIAVYPCLKKYEHLNSRAKALWYFMMGDSNTISYCNKAIFRNELSKKYPESFYLTMARYYHSVHDTLNAYRYYNLTIKNSGMHKNADAFRISANAYYHLGAINNNPSDKIIYWSKGLSSARKSDTRSVEISKINHSLARYYYDRKEYQKSLDYIQQAIISSCKSFNETLVTRNPLYSNVRSNISIEILLLKANALFNAYRYQNHRYDYVEAALNCNELAVQILQERVIDLDDEDAGMAVIEDVKRTMNNAVFYAMRLYQLKGDPTYAEKAIAYAERSKMQVLYYKTIKNEKLKSAGVPDSIILKEEKIQNTIINLENRLALENGNHSDTKNCIIQKLTRLYILHDELVFTLIDQYPVLKQSRYNFKVTGLKQIQNMLEPDQAIIEYQFMMHLNIIFVITRDTFSIQYTSTDQEIRRQVAILRKTITTSPVNENFEIQYIKFTSSSYYLYNELIKPVYNQIKGKRLIIIPHDELTMIPFEVLISKKPGNGHDFRNLPYLVREFPIAYAYSANFLHDQGRNKKYGSGTAVFLPDYGSYGTKNGSPVFEPLSGATSEAEHIKKISGARRFSGRRASEENFKRKSHQYRILHIASHTLLNEENPNLSSLVFTKSNDSIDEGILHSFELRQMKLNAQLVVLSGCNTGYGKLRMNEGLVSLARSFFYTNVRTIVFTLWPVADKSGSVIVSNFYTELKNRQFLDIAMRNAKLDFLRKAEPVRTHPYYWANFMVVGKTENVPLKNPGPSGVKVVILCLLLFAPLTVWLIRKFRA